MRSAVRAVFLSLALFLVDAADATAQFRALIEAGLHGSTLRGQSESDFSPITRLSGGAGMIMDMGSHFQFQPEILYIVEGSRVEGYPFDPQQLVVATVDVTYLQVPLLIAFHFGSARLRPRLFAGPYFSMRLDSQIRFRAASGGVEQTEEDDSIRDRDTGIMFGVGVETEIGGETLMMGLRSSLGFTDARKFNPDRPDNPPLYNTTVGLFAAIVF